MNTLEKFQLKEKFRTSFVNGKSDYMDMLADWWISKMENNEFDLKNGYPAGYVDGLQAGEKWAKFNTP